MPWILAGLAYLAWRALRGVGARGQSRHHQLQTMSPAVCRPAFPRLCPQGVLKGNSHQPWPALLSRSVNGSPPPWLIMGYNLKKCLQREEQVFLFLKDTQHSSSFLLVLALHSSRCHPLSPPWAMGSLGLEEWHRGLWTGSLSTPTSKSSEGGWGFPGISSRTSKEVLPACTAHSMFRRQNVILFPSSTGRELTSVRQSGSRLFYFLQL